MPSHRYVVSFDDDCVTGRRPDGVVESVKWSDLQAVVIVTTDLGPYVDDVFWVLVGKEVGCIVPSEAEGIDLLLRRLQQLPRFDHEAVVAAMTSTQNARFLCWRGDAPPSASDPTSGRRPS